jgi:hypothetical protein
MTINPLDAYPLLLTGWYLTLGSAFGVR